LLNLQYESDFIYLAFLPFLQYFSAKYGKKLLQDLTFLELVASTFLPKYFYHFYVTFPFTHKTNAGLHNIRTDCLTQERIRMKSELVLKRRMIPQTAGPFSRHDSLRSRQSDEAKTMRDSQSRFADLFKNKFNRLIQENKV
jgi:hypothetical protein